MSGRARSFSKPRAWIAITWTGSTSASRDNWNYAHNLSYLIADCAEAGRYREALQHALKLQGVADDPDQSSNPGFYILQIGSSAARLAIRFGAGMTRSNNR